MGSYWIWVWLLAFAIWVLGVSPMLQRRRRRRLPPGPLPLPVIGCLHLLGKEPHRSLTALACKYGSIMSLRLGTVEAVVVSSTDAAKLFLKTHDMSFATRPPLTVSKHLFYNGQDLSFGAYGEGWKRYRKMCVTELLSPKRVESFRHVREEQVSLMMSKLWEDSKQGTVYVDLSDAFFNTLYGVLWGTIARNTVSVMSKELLHLPRQMIEMFMGGFLYDIFPYLERLDPILGIKKRMKRAWKDFDGFADNVLKEHANAEIPPEHNKSFVDLLLDISAKDSFFTKDKIKALILDIFVGGTDTSALTLEWMVSNLLKNPEQLRRAQNEVDDIAGDETVNEWHVQKMKYIRWVMKETLRVNPAGGFLPPHQAVEDVSINGYVVARGTWVLVNMWAIGKDGNVWDEPEVFRPERYSDVKDLDMTGKTDLKSIPFGAGRRGCPGYNMAFQIILLIIGTLLHTFELQVEGDPSELDMSVNIGATLTRKNHLCVLPKLRNNRRAPHGFP